MNKRNRIISLDGIRGIAVILVLVFHYLYRYNELFAESIPFEPLKLGKYGVQLFFIISGFVIYWSINSLQSPKVFLISRFYRLFPTYWVGVLLTFTVVRLFQLPGREVDLQTLLLNFPMIHQYFGVKNVDGVYWTLTVELTFYFWATIFLALKKTNVLPYFLLCCLAVGQLLENGLINTPVWVNRLILFEHASFFLAGICFFKIKNAVKVKRYWFILLLCIADATVIFSLQHSVLFMGFYTLFYLGINEKLSFLESKVFILFGSISYSLYLVHQNIGYSVIYTLVNYNFNYHLAVIIATGFCFTLSILVFKFVETPVFKFAKRRKEKLRA